MDADIEDLINRMDPDETIRDRIREHLRRQRGVRKGFVRLDNGTEVAEGEEPEE